MVRKKRIRLNPVAARFYRIVIALVVFLGVAGGAPQVYQALASGTSQAKVTEVIVERGDTLWDIAGRYAKPGEDIRAKVFKIQELNGFTGKYLQPGQTLRIPAH